MNGLACLPGAIIPPVKPLTRQRLWQIKTVAAGGCQICAAPRVASGAYFCAAHLVKHRERTRRRNGNQPWQKGGVGRPPIEACR